MVNTGFGTLLSALLLASSLVRAAWTPEQIAKNSALGLHLIDLNPSAEPVWKTEDEVLQLMRKKIRFVSYFLFLCCDVAEYILMDSSMSPRPIILPTTRSNRMLAQFPPSLPPVRKVLGRMPKSKFICASPCPFEGY